MTAGYLFSLNNVDSLIDSVRNGVYSTCLSEPNGAWTNIHEGTFADYCSMNEGDNIYFFHKRKIYGIGSIVNINSDCKYLNYPQALTPKKLKYKDISHELLVDFGREESHKYRFICTFIPSPFFFCDGIDMDDILSSSPNSFKVLRVFWKRSFIKFSSEENQAFKNIFLRRNIDVLNNPDEKNTLQFDENFAHKNIAIKTKMSNAYALKITPFLETISSEDGILRHEMAIEASLIYQINNKEKNVINIFGDWDYLSRQVVASPFKPVDYMDKIDIFGYRYISNHGAIICKYLIIEIKRGVVEVENVLQLMKYVDWVTNEYAFGDYSMIEAFIVGHDFEKEMLITLNQLCERKYIYGVRPATHSIWNNMKLINYRYNSIKETIEYHINHF